MSELSFLIELLLNHKLPKAVKTLVADRIKEIEGGPKRAPVSHAPGLPAHLIGQAPSTMAALAEAPPVAVMQAPPVSKRIVGGEVDTGNGTRGPRKF